MLLAPLVAVGCILCVASVVNSGTLKTPGNAVNASNQSAVAETCVRKPFRILSANEEELCALGRGWNISELLRQCGSSERISVDGIRKLHFPPNSLQGPIPQSLSLLTRLTFLKAESNALSGSLPTELINLSTLQSLNFAANLLTGTIPPALGSLYSLTHLNLRENLFHGTLPDTLGQLSRLEQLILDINHLTGTIPHSFGQLARLSYWDMDFNALSGTLPQSLHQLQQLEFLSLGPNALSGTLPHIFSGMTTLSFLNLRSNQLHIFLPEAVLPRSLEVLSLQLFEIRSRHTNVLLNRKLFALKNPDPVHLDVEPPSLPCWCLYTQGSFPEVLQIYH